MKIFWKKLRSKSDGYRKISELSDKEKIEKLLNIKSAIDAQFLSDDLHKDTFENIAAVKDIAKRNGARLRTLHHRHCTRLDVVEVFGLHLSAADKGRVKC